MCTLQVLREARGELPGAGVTEKLPVSVRHCAQVLWKSSVGPSPSHLGHSLMTLCDVMGLALP